MSYHETNPSEKTKHRSDLTISENERAWIGFIRLASNDTDPAPTLKSVQQLRRILAPRLATAGRPDNG